MSDSYIEANGINAPREALPELQNGYTAEEVTKIDLKTAKIKTVIWAMGYTFD